LVLDNEAIESADPRVAASSSESYV